MLIGIDGNEANLKNRVGIGQYAFELISEFAKSKNENIKFRIYLKEDPILEMPPPSPSLSYKIITPKKLWTRFRLPLELYKERSKPDVFFTPSHYGPRFSPIPSVISIMDLSYIYFPDLFRKDDLYQLKNWTKFSALHAARIITISESSKDAIIKQYSLPGEKVVVAYPGIRTTDSPKSVDMNTIKSKYGVTGEFILFVGTLQPRKNIVRLIEAFSKVIKKKKFSNLSLVIIGKRGWLYDEILSAPGRFNIEKKVKFLDFVESSEIPNFYKNAVCTILPSLYEGFGLPVLEAMKYGSPVIASNVSSLPEAGGDAALYVDPLDSNDIEEKLSTLISSEEMRKDMIQKGYKQVKKFSWEKTARETLKVLTEVAGEK